MSNPPIKSHFSHIFDYFRQHSSFEQNSRTNNNVATNKELTKKGVLVLSILSMVVLGLRSPDFGWRSIWAEDGSVFLQQTFSLNTLEYFLQPYNGYYFTLHRLLIYPAHFLPVSTFGIYCFTVAICNYGLCFYVILSSLKDKFSKEFLVLLTFVIAGTPIASGEALQNVNNLQWFWYITWAIFVIYNTKLSKKKMYFFWALSIILICSAPALLPMLLIAKYSKLGVMKERPEGKHLNLLLLCTAIAIGVLQNLFAFQNRVTGQTGFDGYLVIADSFFRLFGGSLFGKILYSGDSQWLSVAIASIIFIFFASYCYIFIFISKRNKPATYLCLMLFTPTIMGILSSLQIYQQIPFTNPLAASRYFVTSSVAINFLILVWIYTTPLIMRNLIFVVFLIGFSMSAVVNFSLNTARDHGNFHLSVVKSIQECRNTDLREATIEISPAGWNLIVPCKELMSYK